MTDKQIIIDGVDVSGCKNLMQGIVPFGCMEDRKTCSCMNNPNCLYKQLKHKEQECEILQMSKNEAKKIITELKAENDTLRQFLSKEHLALQALQSAYSSYKKSTDVFYEMVKQYKQTLAEIKEIADRIVNNYDGNQATRMSEEAEQILQKISEV